MPRKLALEYFDEIKPFVHREYLYLLARVKAKKAENQRNSRIPNITHDLIECSVCHKLIESPDIEECEFCNEDVCDGCWDKHQCEQEFATYEY